MKAVAEDYDVVVCGGGLAGFCAAVAAARHGARTCLVQDRPVLGGNASSEVRVSVHGAAQHHAYARETGIISEILIEERARNHEEINENGWTNTIFDQALYDIAQRTPGLTLQLNTTVRDVLLGDDEASGLAQIPSRPLPDITQGWFHRPACASQRRIAAVVAQVANAETELTLRARTFIDCTGDGLVADLAGCEWRMGSESRAQTGEIHAPAHASTDTMGSSIQIRARDIGRPAPFAAPSWAKPIPNADFFHKKGRHLHDLRGGFWWIEIGVPWHTIHDNETIRHELTAWALGIWDWIKNKDESTRGRAANYALEWFGQVPGKRESRRIMGHHLFSEHDIQGKVAYPDEVAFGGWFVDLHTPGGLLAEHSEQSAAEGYRHDSEYAAKSYVGPYGIPLRCLIAKDVDNLFLAGRCMSATHAALGTARVMGTTALAGQAVGTAAALAVTLKQPLAKMPAQATEVQQCLLRDGCFLPQVANADLRDVARQAAATASSSAVNFGVGADDPWHGGIGDPWSRSWSLAKLAAQWIAVAGGTVDTLAACLDNRSGEPQCVRARLVVPEHIWDYRSDLPVVAEIELTVPPSDDQWVEWPLSLSNVPDGYLRLDLECAEPLVGWRIARAIASGQVAARALSATRLRRLENAVSLAFRVSPGQRVFEPAQVLSGVTRPHRTTNLWRSDPGQPLPQWLELTWENPRTIREVELTFPGHLVRELHAYPPFFRDPETPKTYAVQAWTESRWLDVVVEKENYHRHRRHRLSTPVSTTQLRVIVYATNGDASAALHEIRCYA